MFVLPHNSDDLHVLTFFIGLVQGWTAVGEAGDRQDVRLPRCFCDNHANSDCSRHIPTVVVQGRYDVVCPVRLSVRLVPSSDLLFLY